MKYSRFFLYALASSALIFAGCDDDDDDNSTTDSGVNTPDSTTTDSGTTTEDSSVTDSSTTEDSSVTDSSTTEDSSVTDSGETDSGETDSGETDSGTEDSGTCYTCAADTVELTNANEYGATTRINKISFPTADTSCKCDLVTQTKGVATVTAIESALSLVSLPPSGVSLSDFVTDYVTPDQDGFIAGPVLMNLPDWKSGTAAATAKSDLVFYVGIQDEAAYNTNKFEIDSISYVERDPEKGPMIKFADSSLTCGLKTETAPFSITLPLFGENFTVKLEDTSIKGKVEAADGGYKLTDAVVSGYLTYAQVETLVGQVKTLCSSATKPEICGKIPVDISDPEIDIMGLLDGFIPWDAVVGADGKISGDCVNSTSATTPCNAIGFCAFAEAIPAVITGISEETQITLPGEEE